jgi:hypothetical protein
MKKQGLFLGFAAALLGAAFILAGCESPAGADGSSGAPGPGILAAATVNAAQLEALFKVNSVVQLIGDGTGALTVDGVVPAGKTLVVAAKAARVALDGSNNPLELEVEDGGTLEIAAGAALGAGNLGISNGMGYITAGDTGRITGQGIIGLPYYASGVDPDTDGLVTYADPKVGGIKKAAVSYDADGNGPEAVDSDAIVAILDEVNELSVYGVSNLTAEAAGVPADKTLTLLGDSTLAAGGTVEIAGTLIVEGTLATPGGAATAITFDDDSGALTVGTEGTLTLSYADDAIPDDVTNNGTVSTITTTPATAKKLVALPGSGKVILGADVDADETTEAWELKQDVEIAEGKTLTAPLVASAGAPFSGGKTITVKGTLTLGTANSIGATVVNEGTVSTATTSLAALNTIAAIGGTITSTGVVVDTDGGTLTIPKGSTVTTSSATFANITGLAVNGSLTTTDATFAKVTALTIDGSLTAAAATFPELTTLTVAGTLTAANATFPKLTTLTVNPKATLIAGAAALHTTNTATVTVGEGGSATLGTINKLGASSVGAGAALNAAATNFDENAKLTVGAGAAVNGITFPAATNVTALAEDAPTIDSITVPAGKTLTVPNDKTLTVKADGAVTLAKTGALETESNGKVVFGLTTFSGVGTWTASVTASQTTATDYTGVAITSAAGGATIAATGGSTGAGVLTAGGTSPTITQAAGADNVLTIGANTTVALGGDGAEVGKIVLTGAAANPGKLTFANAGSSDVGTSLVSTGATGADNKVTGTVSAPAGGTAIVWYAANATTGGKWSKVGASNTTNSLVGGAADTDVTLSGVTTVTAAAS